MIERDVVLVDMDGVLADFDKRALESLPPEVERITRQNFYVASDYPEHDALIRAATAHPDFFEHLDLIDGALEGWQRLIDLGYDPRICSAPLRSNPRSIEGKKLWLAKHFAPVFGDQVVKRAIFNKKKYEHSGIALIDDRPEVEEGEWRHIVFDQPYNQLSQAAFRLCTWHDPNLASILEEVKANIGEH